MKLVFFTNLLVFISTITHCQSQDLDIVGDDTTTTCLTPPPFNTLINTSSNEEEQPTIHVVMSITTGDYFTQLIEGIKLQATQIGAGGVNVVVSSADGDQVKQAELITNAASQDPSAAIIGILTVDGSADTLCNAISNALNNTDIQIVSFDFDGEPCSPRHILTSQADSDMASFVLTEAIAQQGQNINVGYVNDLNYAPLMNRNEVWESYKEMNNWNQVFFVENAAQFNDAMDLQNAIEEAITSVEGNVDFIYAPWDYLSINTVEAIKATSTTGSSIAVYGADINTQDIQVMTTTDSPWKATAGGDPRAIGASLARMVAIAAAAGDVVNDITSLEIPSEISDLFPSEISNVLNDVDVVEDVASELDTIEGEVVGLLNDIGRRYVKIPSILVTQELLVKNGVSNMEELNAVLPELTLPDFMQVCWIGNAGEPSINGADGNGGSENDNNHDDGDHDSEDSVVPNPAEASSSAKDVAKPKIMMFISSSLILVLSLAFV